MRAAQIKRYSKNIQITVNQLSIPEVGPSDVLVKIKAAAVNPLEQLILTGSIRLIQDYRMPLTLGNECAGVVEQTGAEVTRFKAGDKVYACLPLDNIGAFADYVAVDQDAMTFMPKDCDFLTAAAIPLTGLTAYQAFTEELEVRPGETVLITGGSGSFGEMAVPIAKALGLNVIVSGNERAKERMLHIGADRYLDYRKENYWEVLSEVDHVIDTLGAKEFEHELAVLKKGGRLLSLRTAPNKRFAERNGFSMLKRLLFTAAGARYDRKARRQGKEYRFMFVRADGTQLEKVTQIVEERQVRPRISSSVFTLEQTAEAIRFMAHGHTDGKVIIRL